MELKLLIQSAGLNQSPNNSEKPLTHPPNRRTPTKGWNCLCLWCCLNQKLLCAAQSLPLVPEFTVSTSLHPVAVADPLKCKLHVFVACCTSPSLFYPQQFDSKNPPHTPTISPRCSSNRVKKPWVCLCMWIVLHARSPRVQGVFWFGWSGRLKRRCLFSFEAQIFSFQAATATAREVILVSGLWGVGRRSICVAGLLLTCRASTT